MNSFNEAWKRKQSFKERRETVRVVGFGSLGDEGRSRGAEESEGAALARDLGVELTAEFHRRIHLTLKKVNKSDGVCDFKSVKRKIMMKRKALIIEKRGRITICSSDT